MHRGMFVLGLALLPQPSLAQGSLPDTLALIAYSDSLTHVLRFPVRIEPRDLRMLRLSALSPPPGYEALHHDLVVAERRAVYIEQRVWQRAGQDREQCLQHPNVFDPDCPRPIRPADDPQLRAANLLVGQALKVINTALVRDLARARNDGD